jgi:hypothetical protein
LAPILFLAGSVNLRVAAAAAVEHHNARREGMQRGREAMLAERHEPKASQQSAGATNVAPTRLQSALMQNLLDSGDMSLMWDEPL